jgi:hypothetical protein
VLTERTPIVLAMNRASRWPRYGSAPARCPGGGWSQRAECGVRKTTNENGGHLDELFLSHRNHGRYVRQDYGGRYGAGGVKTRPRYAPAEAVIDLGAEAGEAFLLHNFLLHRSEINSTASARRAFSVTYMDAKTRTLDTGQTFQVVLSAGALDPTTVDGKAVELIAKFCG